jgi:putative DNA primase/helicase
VIDPNALPEELVALPQWILWRREDRDGQPSKVPYTCQGYRASTTNPEHWSRFDFAMEMAARPGFAAGLGFVFTRDDPYCGIDLDHVWQSDADEGAPWAQGIIERFSDTYAEASPSDTGLKIWCKARTPRCGRWPIQRGAIEVYDHARYFAVTGRSTGIRVITDHQSDIEALVANLDQNPRRTAAPSSSRTVPDVIPQGTRHPTLVSIAGAMWRRGLSPEAIEAALIETNRRQCDPPYPDDHIRKIVGSMNGWAR